MFEPLSLTTIITLELEIPQSFRHSSIALAKQSPVCGCGSCMMASTTWRETCERGSKKQAEMPKKELVRFGFDHTSRHTVTLRAAVTTSFRCWTDFVHASHSILFSLADPIQTRHLTSSKSHQLSKPTVKQVVVTLSSTSKALKLISKMQHFHSMLQVAIYRT